MSEGILHVAAELAVLGANPLPLLTTNDEVIRSFYFKLRDLMLEKREIQDKNFAMRLADEVVKRFK